MAYARWMVSGMKEDAPAAPDNMAASLRKSRLVRVTCLFLTITLWLDERRRATPADSGFSIGFVRAAFRQVDCAYLSVSDSAEMRQLSLKLNLRWTSSHEPPEANSSAAT